MKNIFTLFFLLALIFLSGCNQKQINTDHKLVERYTSIDSLVSDFYSESRLDSLRLFNSDLMMDSIQYPYVFSLEFFLKDIIDYETNKNDYLIKSNLAFYNREKELIIDSDSIFNFNPDLYLSISFEGRNGGDDNIIEETTYYDKYYLENELDTMHQWVKYVETRKYHNWEMSEYPFDVQKLKFNIHSDVDTSMVRLRESKQFPAAFSENLSLAEGFEVESIEFNERFVKTGFVITNKFGNEVEEIVSVGEFRINIKRDGFSLFIKLFLGAFLSLVLSLSVFYIPKGEFDAKSSISVGAIFAAVGNKYFVDSNTISNILTIADIINNSIIFLVILNVLIMIAQRNPNLDWKWLEKDKNAVKFSLFSMVIISLAIIILLV